jgi:hypothetical protein
VTYNVSAVIAANIASGHHLGSCEIHGRTTAQHVADTERGLPVWYCHADDNTDERSGHMTEGWLPESHKHEPVPGSYQQINGDTELADCSCGKRIVQYEFGTRERYIVRWFAPKPDDRRFGHFASVTS